MVCAKATNILCQTLFNNILTKLESWENDDDEDVGNNEDDEDDEEDAILVANDLIALALPSKGHSLIRGYFL